MLYRALKSVALRVMKTPQGPPEAPAGSHASVQIFRASPRYLSYRLLGYWIGFTLLWLLWFVFPVAGLVEGKLVPFVLAGLLGAILLVVQFIAYFTVRIDFDQRYYVVTDRSLRVRQGALIVQEMTVTHANVQNLRIVQGPIQKLFGLSNLKVDTAGGGASGGKGQHDSGHSVQFAGIENAHELRDQLLVYLKQHGRSSGLGDPDDPEHGDGHSLAPRVLDALRAVRDSASALRRTCEGRA